MSHRPPTCRRDISITGDVSDGLTVTGVSDFTLAAGETTTRTLTLTPAAGLPLNTELGVALDVDFGGQLSTTINVPLRVVAPSVDATARAAVASRDLGDPNLADRLDELSIALTRLVENPEATWFKSQATTALDTIIDLLGVDPDLNSFVDPLVDGRDELAAATTPQQVQTAVGTLGDALDDFADTVVNISRHNFTLSLLPNSQVATPLVPRTYEVFVQNTGTLLTDYELTVSGLPGIGDGPIQRKHRRVGSWRDRESGPDADADRRYRADCHQLPGPSNRRRRYAHIREVGYRFVARAAGRLCR